MEKAEYVSFKIKNAKIGKSECNLLNKLYPTGKTILYFYSTAFV